MVFVACNKSSKTEEKNQTEETSNNKENENKVEEVVNIDPKSIIGEWAPVDGGPSITFLENSDYDAPPLGVQFSYKVEGNKIIFTAKPDAIAEVKDGNSTSIINKLDRDELIITNENGKTTYKRTKK